jgi:hypothetical protein
VPGAANTGALSAIGGATEAFAGAGFMLFSTTSAGFDTAVANYILLFVFGYGVS